MAEQYMKELAYLKTLGKVSISTPPSGKSKCSITIQGNGNRISIETADVLWREAIKQLAVRVKSRRELIKELTGITDGIY